MHRCAVTCCLMFSLAGVACAQAQDGPKAAITVADAQRDADFALQGEYKSDKAGVQVVAQGEGQFRVVIHRGGLPGAGWDGETPEVLEEDRDGVGDLVNDLSLEKVERKSPTIGAKPPEGAVVLFDGRRETVEAHWRDGARITDDGLLMEGATSQDAFEDFSLHIEFQLPYMPQARGQARGNSGIYYQGRYETQMLDSFGLEGKDNETGGIYEIRDPDLNMCLPPLSWQTYDVDFTAARYNDQGEKTANARITVRLNGVVVHRDVEIPRTTRAAPVGESPEPGPIYLQNHGNPVRYRNIWVLPRDAQQEARRPIIPAFERFHAAGANVPGPSAGHLLAGELNCTACHATDAQAADLLLPRTGPVLTDVDQRVQAAWIYRFLLDPHGVKPGTRMPNMFAHRPHETVDADVSAIASFLASTGTPPVQRPDRQSARRGDRLFHEVGCLVCHQDPSDDGAQLSTSVPLPDLTEKYSIPSLAAFLKNPLAVRRAGRMPSLGLDDKESQDIAHYLLSDLSIAPRTPNMRYALYRGSWNGVPKIDELTPVSAGECAALDISVARRNNDFAIRFEGFLHIEQAGEYRFHLGSDDGSLLFIDGEKVADSDGTHPHQVNSGSVELSAGPHPIWVDYQQAGGELSLTLDYEGPQTPRQEAFAAIGLTEDPASTPAALQRQQQAVSSATDGFVFQPELVARGRELFQSVGCANCHELRHNGDLLAATVQAKPLADVDAARGCLSAAADDDNSLPAQAIPDFTLGAVQRASLTDFVTSLPESTQAGPQHRIAHVMQAFNCYACHTRDGVGGPERERNASFVTTIPEMGDEGRVPPPLDGVGDKLNAAWLKQVLQNGAGDRPYMLTRMPRFGLADVDQLVEDFVAIDRIEGANVAELDEPEHRVKSTGRQLVGDQALGCIKCHSFGQHRATGIQAMDLQTMTRRLREDWFHRYLPDPQRYRSGTRMPTGFPDGKATIQDVYDGDVHSQVSAIWEFLTDAQQAGVPDGLVGQMIELKPETEPIIYRNFIEGLSPRGIAVGYPERCHLAWDADRMSLALIWHGRFIDAAKHWEGRGPGTQRPLGDHVFRWEPTVPLATLETPDAAWPTSPPKERGYRFRGYQLNGDGRPTFLYETPNAAVADYPEPIAQGDEGVFTRTLTITPQDGGLVWFRAAVGDVIEQSADGWHLVDGAVRVQLTGGGEPVLRESAGHRELLVPVDLSSGAVELVQQIVW